MFSVAAFFSINYIISKLAMHAFAPLTFAWLRVAGAAIVLNAIAPGIGFSRPDFSRIAGFAILGVVINQSLFLTGLSLTSAHIAAILITTIPIFTLLVALVLRLERANAARITGIVLALAGALLVIGVEGTEGFARSALGALLITGNCLAYGIYLVVSKPVVTRLSPVRVVSLMFAIGTVLMLPVSLRSLMREQWTQIPIAAWIGLLLVIAGPTVGAYVINAWTLRYAESSLVAAYTYLQPLLTTVLAWAILHERIRASVAVAALLIFAGVALASRGERPVPAGG